MAFRDTAGSIKLIKPVRRGQGIRLGLAHVGDWPTRGSPGGRFAVVLANWTGESQTVHVRDQRLGARCVQTVSAKQMLTTKLSAENGVVVVSPPLSCALPET